MLLPTFENNRDNAFKKKYETRTQNYFNTQIYDKFPEKQNGHFNVKPCISEHVHIDQSKDVFALFAR